MRIYYRVKFISNNQSIPFNYNIDNALDGALKLGLECIPYLNVDDIIDDYQLGDIVLDGIQQVKYCLRKFNIEPQGFDYPDILKEFLGRKVWVDSINSIANDEIKRSAGYFIKPIKQKAFTGRVVKSFKDLIGCESRNEDYKVLVSEPLNIIYECRGFVYYDKLKDLRPYNGDFKYMNLIDTKLIESAMDKWKEWNKRPNSCSLDWGVAEKNGEYKTVLIEGNLPYALGCYGYSSIDYIKLISAYISQISGVEDELHF